LCITVALIPIVALFLGCDELGFVEFGEKVDLAGNLSPAPWAAGTASPYCPAGGFPFFRGRPFFPVRSGGRSWRAALARSLVV
jgi:hypothetical protein